MVLQWEYVNSWGNTSYVVLGDMRVRFVTAQATTGVQYIIQKDGAQVAIFNSGVTHQNGNAPSDQLKAYSDGFFTITYNNGKVKMYNGKIKSDSNPTGIITWKLNDGSYSTEVSGWDDNDFVSCTPNIKKDFGGPNSVHTVLSDLYLCVYENSVFDEETGAFVSGDIVATMISDAVAQSGVSSDKVLSFMNATYTIYYDGAKLYVKNSNLGTINFTLADGSLGAGVSIAPSQFATGGLQIYKETMGNPGICFLTSLF